MNWLTKAINFGEKIKKLVRDKNLQKLFDLVDGELTLWPLQLLYLGVAIAFLLVAAFFYFSKNLPDAKNDEPFEPANKSKHLASFISDISHEKIFSLSFSGVGFKFVFLRVLILLLPSVPEIILSVLLILSNYFYR